MLRNPDEKTLERVSSEFPQAEQSHKDKMYEKVKERMNHNDNENDNVFAVEVSGVEKYTRRHLWKRVSAAAMSIALAGGALGGGLFMLKNNSSKKQSAEISKAAAVVSDTETTANSVIAETSAEQKIDQSDVDKNLIFAICENGMTKIYDKVSYSYEYRSDYTTGYHMEAKARVYVDSTQDTAVKQTTGGYYRNDGSTVDHNDYIEIFDNNTVAGISEAVSSDAGGKKEFYAFNSDVSDVTVIDETVKEKELLENFDNWEITGFEEYLGRKCAVISGTSDIKIKYLIDEEESFDICTCEFTAMIDYETGIWMKRDIKDTNFDHAHFTYTITDIAFADDAQAPMTKDEFKRSALNDCVKRICDEDKQTYTFEPVNESDLAFLD